MAENKPKDNSPEKEMTIAQAAKLVQREVQVLDKETRRPVIKDGKPVTRMVGIKEDEVFAFQDHGHFVTVVTRDGQKFHGDK